MKFLYATTTEKALREALALRSIKAEVVMVTRRQDGLALLSESKVDGFASDRTTLSAATAASSRSATG